MIEAADPVKAMEDLSAAMQKAVGHFPFGLTDTLYCDCGWSLNNGGKLDWWAHIEEIGFVVGARREEEQA